jgi:high affinity Mn2+ porin
MPMRWIDQLWPAPRRVAAPARSTGVKAAVLAAGLALLPGLALAQTAAATSDGPNAPDAAPQRFALHAQFTVVDQGNFAFRSPYQGPNSLNPAAEGRETADATVYLGVRPWAGAELWINPEIDQGFGLTNTLGVAGFPSGEAYKVGAAQPYFKLQRLFLRQTIDLGGKRQAVDADLNQLAGSQTDDRLVLTLGKFSVVDVFDSNSYAHDPRGDFLNWSLIDTGTFDYAADAWGYSIGAAAEWYTGPWVLRAGLFNLSVAPNSPALETNFSQYQVIGELEHDHTFAGRDGKLKVTWFLSEGRMGRFADAIALAQATSTPADIAAVRRFRSREGIGFNLEQAVTDTVGVFAHGGVADGSVEPYEFSDIDKTLAAGVSIKGKRWSRDDDTVGFAGVINGISTVHEAFLNAGGTGILAGDGKLPHPGPEAIFETFYDLALAKAAHLSFDYQFVNNPAYNRDRGPVSIVAARLHLQY